MTTPIPTSRDVIAFLNARLAARGIAERVTWINVLPYMNPMWMANWEAPELAGFLDKDVVQEELREARWQYPQVMDEC